MDLNNNEKTDPLIFEVNKHFGSLSKNKPEDLELAEEIFSKREYSSQNEYKYERRMGRGFSMYLQPSKDSKFYKLIIPYNFEEKKYTIKEKEIAFYENKLYLLEKLDFFNKNPAFDINTTYNVKGFKKFNLYLPTLIILAISIYLSLILSSLFCFNPIVLYTLFTWNKKAYNYLQMFRFILLEKYKMKEIKRNIDNENISSECQEKKIKWVVGQSGYWLEIQKLIE